jgi:hypothetical protein
MPAELVKQLFQVRGHPRYVRTFLDCRTAPDTLSDAQAGMMRYQASAVRDRLNHRETPEHFSLNENFIRAKSQRLCCALKFAPTRDFAHAHTRGTDWSFHEYREVGDAIEIVGAFRNDEGRLRNAELLQCQARR